MSLEEQQEHENGIKQADNKEFISHKQVMNSFDK